MDSSFGLVPSRQCPPTSSSPPPKTHTQRRNKFPKISLLRTLEDDARFVTHLSGLMQDFQEAARLSAEAKSLASTAQAKEAEAASLASEASAVDSDQIRCIAQVEVCERALAEAELAVAEARCKLLQVGLLSPVLKP